MSIFGKNKNSSGRFDLLLLEEGEYFFEDYSAVRCALPMLHKSSPQPGALGMCKQIRGRIKVCSRSILFDPEDTSIPVSSYSFKAMKAMVPTNFGRNGDQSSPELGSELFVITTTSAISMREDGLHHPYRQETKPTTTQDGSFVLLFALLHTSLNKVMPLIRHLWEIQQERLSGKSKKSESELLYNILQQRNLNTFDSSLLVDFSEKPLIQGAILVTRIIPLVKHPGCLFITSKRVYFQPAPLNNVGDPVVRFRLSNITKMYKRRYMLRHCGLELFTSNGDSLYLSFSNSSQRNYVHDVIFKENKTLENQDTLEDMRIKWSNRSISNYEYLLFLNNQGDRSKNDLTQYPVFPWIIADYESETLDLKDPKSFRDLSKPIGALNDSRLKDFQARYQSMPEKDDEMGIPPPFMYG